MLICLDEISLAIWIENTPCLTRPNAEPHYTKTPAHINTCHPEGSLIWVMKAILSLLVRLLTGWCISLHGGSVSHIHFISHTGLFALCYWDMKDIEFNIQWPLKCIWTLKLHLKWIYECHCIKKQNSKPRRPFCFLKQNISYN